MQVRQINNREVYNFKKVNVIIKGKYRFFKTKKNIFRYLYVYEHQKWSNLLGPLSQKSTVIGAE